jgi:hypothetical protein
MRLRGQRKQRGKEEKEQGGKENSTRVTEVPCLLSLCFLASCILPTF